jgi:cobalt-zinc-cadmium efflux system outer membrane protein
MLRLRSTRVLAAVAGLAIGGCCFPVREHADLAVCDLAARPADVALPSAVDESKPKLPGQAKGTSEERSPAVDTAQDQQRPVTMAERLRVPPELPGANVPPIQMPPATASRAEREAAIRKLYPPLPALGADAPPAPGPEGRALTLADLQRLAMSNSPVLRQASADVEAARGAAIQAGAYPNPNFGYQSDTAGTSSTAGFQGAFIEQVFKTGGKLKLAQAAATMDLQNAELALGRAHYDLMTTVRTDYFTVLTALETVKVTRALARFTEEVYSVQVDQVLGTQAAAYEPLQLRVLALQARAALVQGRNRYTAAWKQLAAAMGLPGMPPTELAGTLDLAVPVIHYDQALARVLSRHTDVLTAQNTVQKSRYNLRLAQVTPVPDVSLHVAIEKDFSMPPFLITHSIQMGVPVPVWDQNKGAIIQAQGQLLRAVEEAHRVRSDLTNRLATAFEQYENNRVLLEWYRDQILPDQVRAYRGVYARHQQDPDHVSFGDIVTAQQTLVTTITTYVSTLGAAQSSLVGVVDLLQTNDLFQIGLPDTGTECVAPIPNAEQLLGLPCCHPCTPLPDLALKGADPTWPPAVPAAAEQQTSRPGAMGAPGPGGPSKGRGSGGPAGRSSAAPSDGRSAVALIATPLVARTIEPAVTWKAAGAEPSTPVSESSTGDAALDPSSPAADAAVANIRDRTSSFRHRETP